MRYRWVAVGAAVLVAAGVWSARTGLGARPGPAAGGEDAALVRQGEYLVNEVAHCNHCHTPSDDNGRPDRSRLLQGATVPIRPKRETKDWAEKSPDITGGGLAGKWSEADFVKFLTTGKNPEGEMPTAPMPVFHLHPEDARAVVLYLKSLPGKKGNREE